MPRQKAGCISPFNDGKAAGCIALRPLSDDKCELKRLYVRPQFRGNGIAGMLCERILEDAEKTGYREIYLDTPPRTLCCNKAV